MSHEFHVSFIHHFSDATEWILDSIMFKEAIQVDTQVRCHRLLSLR